MAAALSLFVKIEKFGPEFCDGSISCAFVRHRGRMMYRVSKNVEKLRTIFLEKARGKRPY